MIELNKPLTSYLATRLPITFISILDIMILLLPNTSYSSIKDIVKFPYFSFKLLLGGFSSVIYHNLQKAQKIGERCGHVKKL